MMIASLRLSLLLALASLAALGATSGGPADVTASHAGGADAFSLDMDPFAAPANFVYEGPCYDAIDDDGDGMVNDGCPEVTESPEFEASCANTTDDDGDTAINDGCPVVGATEWTNPCVNAIDDDGDGWINDGCPGVAYQAIGSREPCAIVERNGVVDWDEDPVDLSNDGVPESDIVVIDLTVENIPVTEPLGEGFTATLNYNETALTVLRNDVRWLLVAKSGGSVFSVSDPAPDTDGNNSFAITAVDIGTGSPEYGSGPLARLAVGVDAGAAPGGYSLTFAPNSQAHIDDRGATWPPDTLNSGFIIVQPVAGPEPCLDVDSDTIPNGADNCLNLPNADQTNTDGDALGDACDSDDDNDLVADVAEGPCGADPLLASKRPERIDGAFAGVDDDGDTLTDEALPAGSQGFDCDGDGYIGTDENHVYAPSTVGDQDPCGTNVSPPTVPASPIGWPADLRGGGIPNSDNRVTVTDLTSFLAPVRYINSNVGDHPGDLRWDLKPGPGIFGFDINVNDMTGLILRMPAMLGGDVGAFNGPACPWPP